MEKKKPEILTKFRQISFISSFNRILRNDADENAQGHAAAREDGRPPRPPATKDCSLGVPGQILYLPTGI